MNWFLLATIFGLACAQPLLFRPYQSRENQKTVSAKTGDRSTTWFENSPAVTTFKCPDGKTICPDGFSCCKVPVTALYTCCPQGFTCDSSTGTCNVVDAKYTDWSENTPAVTTTDWSENSPAVTTTDWSENTPAVTTIRCSASTVCPDETTCCQFAGQYYCCPYANAVCCSNGFCCPHGKTCGQSQCNGGDLLTDLFVRVPSKKVTNIVCPGGEYKCPDGTTCCKLPTGEYGCCPYPNAVCCSDGEHCCPQGKTCDLTHGKCIGGDVDENWAVKSPALRRDNVYCDATHQCPVGSTCCQGKAGQWKCCPTPYAVCCSDGLHCCPQGDTCNVSAGTCSKDNIQRDWFAKTPAKQLKNVVCPGGQSECPDGNTCCKLPTGQWGCCPFPNAVCCIDGYHCCPQGYTCDEVTGRCLKDNIQRDWFVKTPAKQLKNVVCPGGQTQCPDGNTCCKLTSGEWGCCPFPNAVCCSDGLHCCPQGDTCDASAGKCYTDNVQRDWFVKTPAIQLKYVICPDGQSECPDGNTCCKLPSGQWGCCPYLSAVCCSDGLHCCPQGDTCDVSAGTCSKDNIQRDWFVTTPAKQLKNVICPDRQSQCPDGDTCCQLPSGEWGCCPYPNAVCCSDGLHCCPQGETCDVSAGACYRDNVERTWFEKTPAKQLKNVICPDGQSQCPDGNTCCRLPSGERGCCPIPNAVCCSDGLHCCPQGDTCDVSAGTCSKDNVQRDWFVKTPAKQLKNVICPGGQAQCPDGNTCCHSLSGGWECCPVPHAKCCSDGIHCCPQGTTCDVSTGTCNPGDLHIDWAEKTPARQLEYVICPDGQTHCPDGYTCCNIPLGTYGCCPSTYPVCCIDGEHCCPQGTTCDPTSTLCNGGDHQIPWAEKTPARKLNNVKPLRP